MQEDTNTGANWSIGTALIAALGASACCTIPLALVSLGVGGAWVGSLTALAPYRWLFVGLALSALGYAGYNEWRLSRRPDCDCETVFSSTARRALLGIGALVVFALIVSPWLIASSPSTVTQRMQAIGTEEQTRSEQEVTMPKSFRQVVLTVESMTCKTCPITVRRALEDVEGVYSATATFEPPQAVVRFDPETTSVEALTQATKHAGFPSRLKSNS